MKESIYFEQPLYGDYFEPVNTVTNLFFLIAAWLVWKHMQRHGLRGLSERAYLALMVCIALGSAAWHFYQTPVTGLLDVLPIVLIICLGAYRINLRLVQGWKPALAFTVFIMGLIPLAGWALAAANLPAGWYALLPSLILLCGLILACGGEQKGAMLLPFGVFLVSLAFRQIDHWAGQYLSFGSHFMWHFLNSIVLYTMFRAFAGRDMQHIVKEANG